MTELSFWFLILKCSLCHHGFLCHFIYFKLNLQHNEVQNVRILSKVTVVALLTHLWFYHNSLRLSPWLLFIWDSKQSNFNWSNFPWDRENDETKCRYVYEHSNIWTLPKKCKKRGMTWVCCLWNKKHLPSDMEAKYINIALTVLNTQREQVIVCNTLLSEQCAWGASW